MAFEKAEMAKKKEKALRTRRNSRQGQEAPRRWCSSSTATRPW